ncbi:MAG: hypothetical protein ACI8UO_001003 [Verrucomicrobiales bacterium]|jgi:hypothetical protein
MYAGSAFADETVNVLAIGNRFARLNSNIYQQSWRHPETKNVGRANLGGCTLERHWNHIVKFEGRSDWESGSMSASGLMPMKNPKTLL